MLGRCDPGTGAHMHPGHLNLVPWTLQFSKREVHSLTPAFSPPLSQKQAEVVRKTQKTCLVTTQNRPITLKFQRHFFLEPFVGIFLFFFPHTESNKKPTKLSPRRNFQTSQFFSSFSSFPPFYQQGVKVDGCNSQGWLCVEAMTNQVAGTILEDFHSLA